MIATNIKKLAVEYYNCDISVNAPQVGGDPFTGFNSEKLANKAKEAILSACENLKEFEVTGDDSFHRHWHMFRMPYSRLSKITTHGFEDSDDSLFSIFKDDCKKWYSRAEKSPSRPANRLICIVAHFNDGTFSIIKELWEHYPPKNLFITEEEYIEYNLPRSEYELKKYFGIA